jgi:pilus assembly protein CpaE
MKLQDMEDAPLKMVLNRYEKGGWGKEKSTRLSDAEDALGRKFDYYIGDDFDLVSEAINQGVPLSKIKKRSKVEKSITHMFTDLRTTLREIEKEAENTTRESSARKM